MGINPEDPELEAIDPNTVSEPVSKDKHSGDQTITISERIRTRLWALIPFGVAFIPALLVILFYLPSIKYKFVWDDTIYLRDMPAYRNPDLWLDSLFHPFALSPNYFRPLALLSFVTELRFKGLDPAVFHTTNLLLHALNAALVTLLALRILGGQNNSRRVIFDPSVIISIFAGSIYGLHPVLIEGVAFISSRFDLLLTTCLLLALLADTTGHFGLDPTPSTRAKRALLVGVFFFLAALAKEMAVAFAIALPAWHLAISKERSLSTLLKRNGWVYLATLAAGGAYLGIRIATLGYLVMTGVDRAIPVGSILQHILLVFKSVGNYALLVIWPFTTLTPIHFSRLPVTLTDPAAWLALILVIILLVGLVMLIRRQPQAGWLVLASMLALLPVVNLVPLALGGGAFIAERFLLFPMVFITLAVSGMIMNVIAHRKLWIWAPAAIWLLASLASIQLLLPNWRDNLSLWSWGMLRAPRSDTPLTNLALEYTDLGQYQRGAAYAQQAINLAPDNADAWDNLGLALFRMNEFTDAQTAFEKAVSLQPQNALYWNNLAGSLREQNKLADAARLLIEQSLSLDPNLPAAHLNLGIVYLKADRPDLAAQALRNAIQLLPPGEVADAQGFLKQTQDPDRWLRLGELLMQNGQYQSAAQAYNNAAQLGASYADAMAGFTSALIELKDWQLASQVLQQAIRKVPQDARLYNNLGIVAREQGDIESARQLFKKAVELQPQWDVPQQNLQALP